MEPVQPAKTDEVSTLNQKEIEIAVIKNEKQKLEKENKRLFRTKTYFIYILIGLAAGFGYRFIFEALSPAPDNRAMQIAIADSLRSNNIRKDYKGSYIFDTAYVHSKMDTIRVRDSLKIIEKRLSGEIEKRYKAEQRKAYQKSLLLYALRFSGLFILLCFIGELFVKFVNQNEIRKLEHELLMKGAQELKDNIEKDFFTKLVEINFKYLDQYYLQTQEQADKSFWVCVFAASIGFIIIIIGIVMMFQNSSKIEPAYVTTGAGVLSEFIAAIFFYLYNKTVLRMSQYHQKLVITQNISLALKTADALKDSKEKILETVIERLTTDVNKYLAGGL